MIQIKYPKTKEEFEEYYNLRWSILREPWNQPKGSERDELEDKSIHIMAVNESGKIIGIGRLHKNRADEGQIRYMAVRKNYRQKGIGKMILEELHREAEKLKLRKIILNARENAVGFYEKHGYKNIGKTHTLFGVIPHYRMEYSLKMVKK